MSKPLKTIILTFRKGQLVEARMNENITKSELMKAVAYLAERAQ